MASTTDAMKREIHFIDFSHPKFDRYTYESVPLDRDIYLLDEEDMDAYETYFLNMFETGDAPLEVPWFVCPVAARHIYDGSIELSVYLNVYTRFHEVLVHLPRDQFICGVGSWQCDEKPTIFVRKGWIKSMYLGGFSTFCMIDVIGFKDLIRQGRVTADTLNDLRYWIDEIAGKYPGVAFISYGDGLLLKADWRVGTYDSDVKYSYEPEKVIRIIEELRALYDHVFGLPIYAVIAQGANPYHGTDLLHFSASGNHVSLNSLGIPFEQVTAMEAAAKAALRAGEIKGAELYMDSLFFNSFRMKKHDDKASFPLIEYRSKILSQPGTLVYSNCRDLLDKIVWHVKPPS